MADYSVTLDEGISDATVAALADMNALLDEDLRDAVEEGGKAASAYASANAPKRTGRYRRGFHEETSGSLGHYESTVRNKLSPLTHLLTDGHESYNQHGGPYGHVGPASPEGFMDRAFDAGLDAIERRLGI